MKMSLILAVLMACGVARGAAVNVEGQDFETSTREGDTLFVLNNAALLKVKVFFKVYAAGLYLANTKDVSRVLDDVPKRLEIAYLRDIPKSIIVDAAEDYLKANLKPAELAAIRSRVDEINKLYSDVKEGDRYVLTYRPGIGCELALNGKSLGVIPGADFASAYFGIWLGPGCAAPTLRDALLKAP